MNEPQYIEVPVGSKQIDITFQDCLPHAHYAVYLYWEGKDMKTPYIPFGGRYCFGVRVSWIGSTKYKGRLHFLIVDAFPTLSDEITSMQKGETNES